MRNLAWVVFWFEAAMVILFPMIIGKEKPRGIYSFGDWVARLIGSGIIMAVALYAVHRI